MRWRVEARQQRGEAAERSTRATYVGGKIERWRDGGVALQRRVTFVRWVCEQQWPVRKRGLQPGCELRGSSCHKSSVRIHEEEMVHLARVR